MTMLIALVMVVLKSNQATATFNASITSCSSGQCASALRIELQQAGFGESFSEQMLFPAGKHSLALSSDDVLWLRLC